MSSHRITNSLIVYLFVVMILTSLLVLISSCSDKKDNVNSKKWADTTWTYLEGESIKFRKPNSLKRSSRYRLKADLPMIAQDSAKLLLIEQALEKLEFEDDRVDVFVDTTTAYRFIIICNIEKIDFNRNDIARIKKQVEFTNEQSGLINPTLLYGDVKATLSGNTKLTMAHINYNLKNIIEQETVSNHIYFMTSKYNSVVIHEVSDSEETIEKHLWTIQQ